MSDLLEFEHGGVSTVDPGLTNGGSLPRPKFASLSPARKAEQQLAPVNQAAPINEHLFHVASGAGFNVGLLERSELRSQRNRSSRGAALHLHHLHMRGTLGEGGQAAHQRKQKAHAFMDGHSIDSMGLRD